MKDLLSPDLSELLAYVRLAPSVHNTQPWTFSTADDTLTLSASQERTLGPGDPTGRELWISLGICIETVLQAAHGLGFKTEIVSLQTESTTKPVATIKIVPGDTAVPHILSLIKKRQSYRQRMKPASLPVSLLDACQQSVSDLKGISVHLLKDRRAIEKIAELTDKGMRLALSSPEFRKELGELVNHNWSSARTGMPGYVLNRGMLGSVWERWSIVHGQALNKKASADKQKVLDASGLIFIATKGDVPKFWLQAGRAYFRVALQITNTDFVHSTIAAPVEAASFHEDIEQLLGTKSRIQAMIRIGKATKSVSRPTPRLHVDELLT
ncbi:MAG TPA: hypothetical protein VK502_00010 [Candidatus Saccharimonadales bacterium]|nr:hypothetical protein [Candidatus Saccharimonadales bacterium]